MSKARAYLLAVCTLILGTIFGGLMISHWYQRHFAGLWAEATAAQIEKDHATLYYFRTGDTNKALQLMEIDLDGQMGVLDSVLKEIPAAERDTNDLVVLDHAREYRKAFPTSGMAGQ